MKPVNFFVSISCLLALFAAPAGGWSTKEHILMTRLAVERLLGDEKTPAAMKQWLRDAAPDARDLDAEKEYLLHARVGAYPRDVGGLAYWSVVPDMNAMTDGPDKVVAPFGVGERLLHFIDVEFFNADPAKRAYAPDLSHKPALADFPDDPKDARYKQAGMLPFRVRQCYASLVAAVREGRLNDKPGQFPRDEHAAKWAGMLAHYVEDNTQPHHATIDYKTASYFPDEHRPPNIHANMEYRLVDDDAADYPELREEFWKLFSRELADIKDPVTSGNPWRSTIEVSLASYDALPLIGKAAVAAYTKPATQQAIPEKRFDAAVFFHFTGPVSGKETSVLQMKAHQMAWAVARVQRLWLQAWNEAASPPSTAPVTRPMTEQTERN